MLKQFSVFQKILGSIVLLFVWSLFIEQGSADAPTGTIAFLSDRDKRLPVRGDLADIGVYLIDADGFNETALDL